MRGYNELDIIERKFSKRIKGLYIDDTVAINASLNTVEKACVLAEELGHYHTSYGDITNQEEVANRKQEKRARNWGYEKLLPLERLIHAYKQGCRNRYEIAEFLDLTEEFLECAIRHYQEKYGLCYKMQHYILYFDPLGVLELF